MKLTLLDIVQDIANDLEADNINSINDTIESLQIAQIVKTTFFEMIANRNWPHLKRTLQMESSLDAAKPTHLKLPTKVKELEGFSYNKQKASDNRKKYEYLLYVEPEVFLFKTNQRDSSQSTVDIVTDFGGIDLLIRNDKHPEYYTSFDDKYVVCDSHSVQDGDTTLQVSKTQLLAVVSPGWQHDDDFIPDLPEEAFPALLEEAKSTSFVVIKQQANEKAEQKASRQQRWLSRKAWRVKGGVNYPDYGRKKHWGGHRKNPQFNPDYKI